MKFRSKFEKAVYEKAKRSRKRLDYEPRDGTLRYILPAEYRPDFRLPNGILIEAKGYFSPRDRRKMLAVRRDNPECDIRMVFQRASNRLTKSKNSITYGEWADRHGFVWAEGAIPTLWWRE